MGNMSPEAFLLLGFLTLLYGVLVGGAWVRRDKEGLWDTVSTVIFTLIAAVATVNLVFVTSKQAETIQQAREKLDCVATQITALRQDVLTPDVREPIPVCDVHWDK